MEDSIALYVGSQLVGWLTVTGKFEQGGTIALHWQSDETGQGFGEIGDLIGQCESAEFLRLAKHFAKETPPPPAFGLAIDKLA